MHTPRSAERSPAAGTKPRLLARVRKALRVRRVPLVLSRQEVAAVLRHLHGVPWLMASVLYGAGLRLTECARLRVKDVDFTQRVIAVRDGNHRDVAITMIYTLVLNRGGCGVKSPLDDGL